MSAYQHYRFKYANVSLQDYIKDRKFAAELKRREANILVKQAETIESEMWELESNLLLAPSGLEERK